MHIRCIVTERNEATVDPALVAEFTEIFSKTSPQEEIGYLSQDQIEAFQKEQELAEIADEDDMAELLRQMKS